MIHGPAGHRRSLAGRLEGKGSPRLKGTLGPSPQGAVKLRAPAFTAPSGEPRSRPGGPGTRRTPPEAEGSGTRKGLQEVVPKEPPTRHVPDTHLFTISRPGRSAVPCKFGIAPARCAAQGAGCVWESLGCDHGWSGGGGECGRTGGSLRAPTGSLGTAAGRASSARSRPGCCSAALGRPLLARGLLPPRCCLLLESVHYPIRLLWATQESGFPFPLLSSQPSRTRTPFLT